MRVEDSVTVGVGTLATCVIASGIIWYTVFRFLRWVVG